MQCFCHINKKYYFLPICSLCFCTSSGFLLTVACMKESPQCARIMHQHLPAREMARVCAPHHRTHQCRLKLVDLHKKAWRRAAIIWTPPSFFYFTWFSYMLYLHFSELRSQQFQMGKMKSGIWGRCQLFKQLSPVLNGAFQHARKIMSPIQNRGLKMSDFHIFDYVT